METTQGTAMGGGVCGPAGFLMARGFSAGFLRSKDRGWGETQVGPDKKVLPGAWDPLSTLPPTPSHIVCSFSIHHLMEMIRFGQLYPHWDPRKVILPGHFCIFSGESKENKAQSKEVRS